MAVKKTTEKKAVTAKKTTPAKASAVKKTSSVKKATPAKKTAVKKVAPALKEKEIVAAPAPVKKTAVKKAAPVLKEKEVVATPVKKENLIKGLTAEAVADLCVAVADDRKAVDIKKIKVSSEGALSDYFVICTGNSEPHIRAIAEKIARDLRNNNGIRPRATEGTPASKWIVIDYFAVVVHVLTPEMRDNYRLEDLWENPDSASLKKTAVKKEAAPKKTVVKKTIAKKTVAKKTKKN